MASFRVGSKETEGSVIKRNPKTILVRLEDGKIIKRHLRRHNVVEAKHAVQ